jgi:CheY-like chemotaxis protein/carbonic anhydrase/acetyltransferase-like protein (isoleucine patch superfamily)
MPTERVLLVDDEQEFLTPLSKRLILRGFKVTTANSGAEALALLEQEFYGAVVLDLVMPDMDGLETLRQILKKNPSQQVILLTGKGTGAHESEALKLGALDFLRKPVEMETLVERLKTNNLQKLKERILRRVAVNLAKSGFNATSYAREVVPMEQFCQFYAFYGLTHLHPLRFSFSNSGLAGSYFLGKCVVEHSLLYKCDVRGDELKTKGQVYAAGGMQIPLHHDEVIHIIDCFLIKTLIHNYSHDPEDLETFSIRNTIALPNANIHGAPMKGCFLGPFATADLTTLHDCVLGAYSYVQTGELAHAVIPAGLILIRSENVFEFSYQHDPKILERYIRISPGEQPKGEFMAFVESRQDDFQPCFDQVCKYHSVDVPAWSSVSPYAVIKGDCTIGVNVLVCQRAYLENARLGRGANAQEHCYIIDSELAGSNITAHGAILIHCRMGEKVFVAFNSFLRGTRDAPLVVGTGCMVMPHTIIDLEEPLEIPPRHVIWGHIRNAEDLKTHILPIEKLRTAQGRVNMGNMRFSGSGAALVSAFEHRIDHILEANGASFDGEKGLGHAQKNQTMSFNTIQPYAEGPFKGLYPAIEIRPIDWT